MKSAIVFLLSGLTFASCKKDQTPAIIKSLNKPPVANAGRDQMIFLPVDSITLSGSLSSDPDGSVISYNWSQVTGPSQSTITGANARDAKIKGLSEGTFQYRLRIQDDAGATDDDTIQVIVVQPGSIPVVNTRLTRVGTLSVKRQGMAAAAAGSKILFAGGFTVDDRGEMTGFSSRVDIYDYTTNNWSTAELSKARYGIAAAGAGNKIAFAGGASVGDLFRRVDLYDISANSWTTAELSRGSSGMAAASLGNKMFFTGGGDANPWDYVGTSNLVDIYDASLNNWSTATLSQARGAGIAAASVGTQVLFAGGWNSDASSESDRVDIFDAATRLWSTASLSRAQSVSVATTVGNSVIFAVSFGGAGNTWAYADKFDASNGNWSIISLSQFNFLSSQPVIFSGAATSGNLAVFFPSSPVINRLIIYNAAQGTWGISSEGLPFGWRAAIATVNNQIYVSDGEGVWKIEF